MRCRAAAIVAVALLCSADAAHALQAALPPDPAHARSTAEQKSPALARVIGILPGAGHLYAGEPGRGLVYFGATLAATIIAYNAPYDCTTDLWTGEEYCSETTLGSISMMTMLGLWGWSIYDAGRAARRTNARRIRVTGMLVGRTSRADAGPMTRVGLTVQWARGAR